MKTLVLSALLFLASAPALAGPLDVARGTQVSFSNAAGEHQCGGTAVGKHTVLTATHCLTPKVGIVSMDGTPVQIEVVASDGKDHSLVRVNRVLTRIAKIGAPPQAGDPVFIWGSPHGLGMLLRRGHYSGVLVEPATKISYHTYDVEIINGDSGSAVFNSEGKVVGMVSQILSFVPHWRMMINPPFAFTQKQIKEIK